MNCWCEEADADPLGPERKERCRRLTADVAAKVVTILNARHANDATREKATAAESPAPSDAASCPPESCVECHSTPGKEKEAGTTTAAQVDRENGVLDVPRHETQSSGLGRNNADMTPRGNLPISVTNERSVL